MIRYIVIYTFLLSVSFNGHYKLDTYGRFFTDRAKAYTYYLQTVDDCVCDSTQWKFITRREMFDGVIVLVEFDSIVK